LVPIRPLERVLPKYFLKSALGTQPPGWTLLTHFPQIVAHKGEISGLDDQKLEGYQLPIFENRM